MVGPSLKATYFAHFTEGLPIWLFFESPRRRNVLFKWPVAQPQGLAKARLAAVKAVGRNYLRKIQRLCCEEDLPRWCRFQPSPTMAERALRSMKIVIGKHQTTALDGQFEL